MSINFISQSRSYSYACSRLTHDFVKKIGGYFAVGTAMPQFSKADEGRMEVGGVCFALAHFP